MDAISLERKAVAYNSRLLTASDHGAIFHDHSPSTPSHWSNALSILPGDVMARIAPASMALLLLLAEA